MLICCDSKELSVDVDKTAGCWSWRESLLEEGWRERGRERGRGLKREDYGRPAVKGLLLEPEKVCRKSATHSANIPTDPGPGE